MTWETIPLRGGSVSASWRFPGGKGAGRQLCLTISSGLCEAIGLRPGRRVVVQRDRIAGKIRLTVVDERVPGARSPRWKPSAVANVCMLWVPLLDVEVAENKPAKSAQPTESALLRLGNGARGWTSAGVSVAEIRAQLAALDGPPIPETKTILYHWGEWLGLPTNRQALAADFADAPVAARVPAEQARATAAGSTATIRQATGSVSSGVARTTNGVASRAALPTEHPDKAEAVDMLRAGQTARYVAEEFGLPIATVATWAAEVRAQDGRAA